MYCKYCVKDCRTRRDGAFISCNECGRILEEDDFTDEPTFSKGAGGESRMNGVFVSRVQNDHRESFERTLEKGKQLINYLMTKFQSNEGQLHAQASNFYRFLEISGRLIGGSEPPSFQVAEMNIEALVSAEKEGCPYGINDVMNDDVCNTKKDSLPEAESDCIRGSLDRECNNLTLKDGDNLSDIDDLKVNCYFASEEESRLKKIIWEEMNKEYLQEQAAKDAAVAAYMKDLGDAPEDVLDARKLAAAAAAATVDRKREQRRLKRALEAKNAGMPQTAAEATRQMLTKKGFSSKINYEYLDKLFDEDMPLSTKKVDAETPDDNKTLTKKARKEEKENAAKKRNELEENEETIEEEVGEEEVLPLVL